MKEQIIDLEVSVRYTDCVRVIRMNMGSTLYDLHLMIQRAVAFDNDHLFEFTVGSGMMKRKYALSEFVNSDRDLPVETTKLGDMELRKGQKFTYLFDFGDCWQFDIKVLDIQAGMVNTPKVIKAVNDAPDQYPDYDDEEEMDVWKAELSDQVQISDILSSIDDELIRDEYAALAGRKDSILKEAPAVMRQEMERILRQNPDRMLIFMTAEMRKMLSRLFRNDGIDESEKCTLAQLYAFGFCLLPEKGDHTVAVPEAVKEIYAGKMKSAGKWDKIVDAAEAFLKRCGVMEMKLLHSAVAGVVRSRISYEDFDYLVYSRLHYFGAYYCECFHDIEYVSCYDRELTQKILAERQKPENAVFDYPDFDKTDSAKKIEIPDVLEKWLEYVRFHLNIDWQTAENLMSQIPVMAASGIYEREEIKAAYKDMLRGTGSRVTKKAEGLIDELCMNMPLATRKGNTGLKDSDAGSAESKPDDAEKPEKGESSLDKMEVGQAEYAQLSIFDL